MTHEVVRVLGTRVLQLTIVLIGLGLVLGLPTSGQVVDPDVKCYADVLNRVAPFIDPAGTTPKKVRNG